MFADWHLGQADRNDPNETEACADTGKFGASEPSRRDGAIRARTARPVAPPFTREDRETVTAWLDQMTRCGMSVEITTRHAFLAEALQIVSVSTEERLWLIHKTPDGRAAVREWPGIATIVPTIADALSLLYVMLSSERSFLDS